MTDKITIGKFDMSRPLMVRMAANGGWLVEQQPESNMRAPDAPIGAYTTAADMLNALAKALVKK